MNHRDRHRPRPTRPVLLALLLPALLALSAVAALARPEPSGPGGGGAGGAVVVLSAGQPGGPALAEPAASEPPPDAPTGTVPAPEPQPVEPGDPSDAQSPPPALDPHHDPFLWLEEVDGAQAMSWVHAQNAATAERLEAQPEFEGLYRDALAVLGSPSRVPDLSQRGRWLYNLWKDEQHPRGVYRRTTLEELRKARPQWQVVLDLDALAAEEGRPWVFKGMTCLPPAHRRCLVSLSPGGGDASEHRELDAETLRFVADGFRLPVAKSNVAWRDEDHLYVGTDFGPGSLTDSGYPRIVKLWRRGTPLSSAVTLHEGERASVSVSARRLRTDAGDIDLVSEARTTWEGDHYQIVDGRLLRLDLPATAVIEDAHLGRLVISLKQHWHRGSESLGEGWVVVADPAVLRGGEGGVEVLVAPGAGEVVEAVEVTRKGILVTLLENVRGRLYRYEPAEGGRWHRRPVPFSDHGALSVSTVDDETGDFLVVFETFLTPRTLYHVPAAGLQPVALRAQEATFDGSRFQVSQHWATSRDGTRVPYFMVARQGLELDGRHPTHIFSYGGFRLSLTPSYSGSYEALHGAYGRLWLQRGGVFVLANIRGGGELGPSWHAAALGENRHRSFEDFEAVAEDLVARRVTSPQHLGIEGRSNGGLLVGATMTRRPELYGAVVNGVPLADMRRYHLLLAGASWMAEFGNPDDPAQWAFIRDYSPYHNLEAGRGYPPVFFYASTRDDRVHPGHARKMAAKLESLGYEVWYYENTEGGHGGSVTNEQLAYRVALAYTHLWSQLRPRQQGAAASRE
jgi:prolyl oligopeptidase